MQLPSPLEVCPRTGSFDHLIAEPVSRMVLVLVAQWYASDLPLPWRLEPQPAGSNAAAGGRDPVSG